VTAAGARIFAAPASLRSRMLVALVVTSVATLAAAALVTLTPLERRVERDRLDALRGLARTIRPELAAVPVGDRHPGSPVVLRAVARLQRRTGGRIIVFDSAGATLADTASDAAAAPPSAGVLARVRAGAAQRRGGVIDGESEGVAFAATVAGAARDRLTLVIAQRLDDSRAAAAVARSAVPLALAAGLAVALALALVLSRSLLRRLDRLEADARALGTEGLHHRIAVAGTDEISVVARALEDVRGRLVVEQETRQAFIATASHELRTPLASLQATLELLDEELRGGSAEPDVAIRRAEAALRQTHRLVALATDLLDLSRIDSAAPLRPEPIELGEIARAVAPEFVARLDTAGRSLTVAGGPAVALADPAALARILRILLDNAANYGGGAVSVTLAGDEARAQLAVEDEGPGVAPEESERIFRRFSRGHAAAAAAGAGLGLAIARGLAGAMGGSLVVEPVARGARFVLTLRAATAEGTDDATYGRASAAAGTQPLAPGRTFSARRTVTPANPRGPVDRSSTTSPPRR
jgi:signal transduction histidine kinase